MKEYERQYLLKARDGKAGPLSEARVTELRAVLAKHRGKGPERHVTRMTAHEVRPGVLRFTTEPLPEPPESGDPAEAVRLLRESLENEGK